MHKIKSQTAPTMFPKQVSNQFSNKFLPTTFLFKPPHKYPGNFVASNYSILSFKLS